MTAAQQEAYEKCERLMREHFDAGVLVILTEYDDQCEQIDSTYHGGRARCLGLYEVGRLKLLNQKKVDEPE